VGDVIRAYSNEKFEAVEITLREKFMDLRQELADDMDCLNVGGDEAFLVRNDKTTTKDQHGVCRIQDNSVQYLYISL